jgi:parallel beta-helix repeat protein
MAPSGRLRAALLLGTLALAACDPRLPLGDEPVGTPSGGSQLIGCDRAAEVVVLTADAHLDPACTYTGGFEITGSGVTFDCRGARIEDVDRNSSRGVHIHAPADVVLADVTVRNCIIVGFLNNVRVSRDGFQALEQGADYEHPFADIVVENSRLLDSRGSGFFVNAFVTGVTIQDLEIARAGSVGIYLEASSRGSVVRRNTIHHNGFADVDPVNGVPQVISGVTFRVLMTGREGIAVDGSRDNVITDNAIHDNAAGGIFLYKNCGEFVHERPASWWERWYGADDNLIERNVIVSEDHGIWVGSRMNENQLFMDCSDPVVFEEGGRRYHLDMAAGNTLRENLLVFTGNAIRVEDDRTTVEGNVILDLGAEARGVVVGTGVRTTELGRPVDGTVVRDNHVNILGNPQPYTWIHGHTGTVFEGNTAGDPAAPVAELAPGTQPPVNPALFVIRAWLP